MLIRSMVDSRFFCVMSYRGSKLKFHAANSGAILHGLATDLDFVRPGIAVYGLPPGQHTL